MAYDDYRLLKTRHDRGVLFVTIDHPPINLFDRSLMQEVSSIGREATADEAVKVMVFDSANPEFFIAHADVEDILQMPTEVPPKATELVGFQRMVERYRVMPKVTMAKIEGRTGGGGSEFVLSLDMRFAALGRAVLNQPEVALGIIPGGSGTQRLPRLMGRGRALEIILGCDDFPADLAERYGYVNRALPPENLSAFVERLAYRIASFPAEALRLAKSSVLAAEVSTRDGLLEEAHAFNQSLATTAAQTRMQQFLALGGQTRPGELDLAALLARLAD
jgi:enoyl-CoA hydratase/carnithine racemase